MKQPDDEKWMALALEEGRKGLGLTSPNPAVGAVIVKNGQELSRGWHHKAGQPHAEREALNQLDSEAAQGATAYVTLEPCSTVGRTGACCTALIEAGITRVVYGTRDPNPSHAGNADQLLKAAGIEVVSGVLEEECLHFIRGFAMTQTEGRPWVIAKTAMSLDGRITRPADEGQWLTGAPAREEVQWLRREVDAIITSGETVRADNPALTVSAPASDPNKEQPLRVILTHKDLDRSAYQVFLDEHRDRSLVFKDRELYDVLRTLTLEYGVCSVLLEAGGGLLGAFQDEGLIDEWVVFLAPLVTGGPTVSVAGEGTASLAQTTGLQRVKIQQIGRDLCARGSVRRDGPRELERGQD